MLTVSGEGVGAGVGETAGVGTCIGVGAAVDEDVGLGRGVRVGVGAEVGEATGVGACVGVGAAVDEDVGVEGGVNMGVWAGVGEAVGARVCVEPGKGVAVDVTVVAVGLGTLPEAHPFATSRANMATPGSTNLERDKRFPLIRITRFVRWRSRIGVFRLCLRFHVLPDKYQRVSRVGEAQRNPPPASSYRLVSFHSTPPTVSPFQGERCSKALASWGSFTECGPRSPAPAGTWSRISPRRRSTRSPASWRGPPATATLPCWCGRR